MIFRQLFEKETSTYTYLIADEASKKTLLIDPVDTCVERDLEIIKELGLDLSCVIETHVHADHITAASKLRSQTGAQIIYSSASQVSGADTLVPDGETLSLGELEIKFLHTPGHTDTCMCILIGDRVFTGDTLLIRGCGRTDFQSGSAETLFQSVREKLFRLPDATYVYPGHDYKGRTRSTIGEEKVFNPRLKMTNSLDDFIGIMNNLNLAEPKKIKEAVPANLRCGASS